MFLWLFLFIAWCATLLLVMESDNHLRQCWYYMRIHIWWNENSGNFYPAFDNVQLIYPFTLSPHSSAVGKADAALTQQSGYIFDLRGKSRLEDDAPDIGAYEAQLEEEQK